MYSHHFKQSQKQQSLKMNGADFHNACTQSWQNLKEDQKAHFEKLCSDNRIKYEKDIKEYNNKMKQKEEEE